ncbi:MAG: hypothetical protein KDB03_28675 [Planctomycetales bacterium]|nr:hypothetical protein [Planctomycetales bacterium]
MSTVEQNSIVTDLVLNETHPVDLLDSVGNVLLRAGTSVTGEFIAHLAHLGISEVFFRTSRSAAAPYSVANKSEASETFKTGTRLLSRMLTDLLSRKEIERDQVTEINRHLYSIVKKDPAPIIAEALTQEAKEPDARFTERCITMSLLSLAIATELQFSETVSLSLANAALLHDASLALTDFEMLCHPEFRQKPEYLVHPLRSVELLRSNVLGISNLELILVAQVHEQVDGSGFPAKLHFSEQSSYSAILNTVDAFLTLINTTNSQGGFYPNDSLAYLANHASLGRFDLQTVKALIQCVGLYPPGTLVKLSDNRIARVLRPTRDAFSNPVVQAIDHTATIFCPSDLRLKIVSVANNRTQQRISREHIGKIFWK